MKITAGQVKELRQRTGVGIMDCKQALQEAGGDLEEAIKVLRRMGKAKAAMRAEREASEGRIEAYVHTGARIGVLIEVNCETDFVARSEELRRLARDLAMQVAAANPRFIRPDDVDEATLEEERRLYRAQALAEGKPEAVVERIVEGRVCRFLAESCLYEQPFIRDPDRTVGDIVAEVVSRVGEKVAVRRFVRFGLGDDRTTVVSGGE